MRFLRPLASAALALALASTASFAEPNSVLEYQLALDEKLSRFDVQVCLTAGKSRKLSLSEQGQTLLLDPAASITRSVSLSTGECIRYTLATDYVPRRSKMRSSWQNAQRIGRALLFDFAEWLAQPGNLNTSAEVSFLLPENFSVSAPWTPIGDSDRRWTFLLTPSQWRSCVIVGEFEQFEMTASNTRVRVALLDTKNPVAAKRRDVERWLRHAVMTVADVSGAMSLPSMQVLVVPTGPADEAVPFAQVLRGGGTALRFFVDGRYPSQDVIDDWTSVHEFSHTLHPLFKTGDAWFAEGLASYYQNILRARTGVLDEVTAWQKLHEGFQRGVKQLDNRDLRTVASEMHRERRYMRVYWSGAAIALLADVQLRAQSNNEQSLDTALAAFQSCCLPATRAWSSKEFARRLDELTSTDVFSKLVSRWANSAEFPDYQAAFEYLGIQTETGRVQLSSEKSEIARRRAITE